VLVTTTTTTGGAAPRLGAVVARDGVDRVLDVGA
jgi:hypothetical protein